VRIAGIDAPEQGQACFAAATERLRELANSRVRVEPGPEKRDPYGRSLYYVYGLGGDSIDAIMIREGLATAWRKSGQHVETLRALEQTARDQRTGCLWR